LQPYRDRLDGVVLWEAEIAARAAIGLPAAEPREDELTISSRRRFDLSPRLGRQASMIELVPVEA
jgi:hypothetical protein